MEAIVNFPFFGGATSISKLSHLVKWPSLLILPLLFFELLSSSRAETNARCDEICNNNRPNGSNDAYVIDCGQIYAGATQLEKIVCSDDCRYCNNNCDLNVDPFVFNCPAINGGNSKQSREWDWGVDRPGDKRLSTGVIIAISIGCLILLCCIGGCIYGCFYMSRQRQTGIHLGPTAMGQYYGPPAAADAKGKSKGRKSNDLTNYNFVDGQGVQRTPMDYFSPSQRELATTSSVV